jgi:hypothetical protein
MFPSFNLLVGADDVYQSMTNGLTCFFAASSLTLRRANFTTLVTADGSLTRSRTLGMQY